MTVSFVKPLSVAFDELCAAFASVPAPVSAPYCNHCCVTDEEMAALLAFRPLREIPRAVLQPYLGNLVVRTAGSEADSRYFFPRILELVVAARTYPELPMVAQFLAPTASGWPRRQRVAVRDLFRALFAYRLNADPYPTVPVLTSGKVTVDARLTIEEILCAAAHLTSDLRPFLAHWAIVMEQRLPSEQLLSLLERARTTYGVWQLPCDWWQGRQAPIYWWKNSRELRYAVARRIAAAPDDEDAALLGIYAGVPGAARQWAELSTAR